MVAIALAAQQSSQPLLQQLDPPRRAAVLMALLGLVILGILMVVCVMIGARWVRRITGARRAKGKSVPGSKEQWRRRLAEHLPDVDAGETAVIDRGTDETVAD